jgi:hypothetical protein
MNKLAIGAALLTASAAALTLSSSAAAPAAGASIAFSKSLYLPGEHAFLTVSGAPGTIVVLGFDTDPGPTDIPGIGSVDLGLSQHFLYAVLPPLPAEGQVTLEWHCEDACADTDEDLHVQGIAIDPVTFALSVTNSDVLNIEDLHGQCAHSGCTPGYWKNHPETWGPTGYSPDDDFDTVFGVDAFQPDLTLMQALDPTNPLSTFASHAVAALLNSSHPSEEFGVSPETVVDLVQEAYADGTKAKAIEIKDIFENLNTKGCPF